MERDLKIWLPYNLSPRRTESHTAILSMHCLCPSYIKGQFTVWKYKQTRQTFAFLGSFHNMSKMFVQSYEILNFQETWLSVAAGK